MARFDPINQTIFLVRFGHPSAPKMSEHLNLPEDEVNWSTGVIEQGINHQSISTFSHAASGSKIGFKQFLLLRVLWATDEARDIQKRSEWLSTRLKTAGKLLRDISDWKHYTSSCNGNSENQRDQGLAYLGTFALVRLYQLNAGTIATSPDKVAPKLDVTPIAMRTRSRIYRGGRQTGTATPPSPTPLPRHRDDPRNTRV